VPAIHGVRQGLLLIRIRQHTAIAIAGAVTLAMVFLWSTSRLWVLAWVLIWPAWYIVATAQGPGAKPDEIEMRSV
jgi:hypothetical protein